MENTIFSSLKNIAEEIRNQIFVDEATDFSCFELKAMYLLTNHKLNSFLRVVISIKDLPGQGSQIKPN